MERNYKQEIRGLYKEAADTMAFHGAQMEKDRAAGKEIDARSQEYYAECRGRRQAIGEVLKTVFGAGSGELQQILDMIYEKYEQK